MSSHRRAASGDRGASAVELALLTPLLATLLIGSIQLGFLFNRAQDLEAAARDAARYASDDDTRSKTDIIDWATSSLEEPTGVTVTIDPDVEFPCDGREGLPVVVSLSVPEKLDILFVSTVTVDLGGTAEFFCSNNQVPPVIPTPIPTPTPTPTPTP